MISITTYISSALLILLILAALFIVVRSAYMPRPARRPGLGWMTLALYLCGVLGALLVWGRDAEGVGIATVLLGMPWSAMSTFVLNSLLHLRTGLFGATWETTTTILSLGAIGLNCWLAYQVGQRLPALWIAQRRSF